MTKKTLNNEKIRQMVKHDYTDIQDLMKLINWTIEQ